MKPPLIITAIDRLHQFHPHHHHLSANEFWGINQSIRYGASTTILSSTAGVVDTGKWASIPQ